MRILLVLFLSVNLSCVIWNKAVAGSNDIKFDKPDYIKFDNKMRSSSFDKDKVKIPTPDFVKPITEPSFDKSMNTISKPDYIKYKQPDLPDLNKDLKIAPADDSLRYFYMGLHYEKAGRIKDTIESYKKFITFSPPNKNTPYIDYAKQSITRLEKIQKSQQKSYHGETEKRDQNYFLRK